MSSEKESVSVLAKCSNYENYTIANFGDFSVVIEKDKSDYNRLVSCEVYRSIGDAFGRVSGAPVNSIGVKVYKSSFGRIEGFTIIKDYMWIFICSDVSGSGVMVFEVKASSNKNPEGPYTDDDLIPIRSESVDVKSIECAYPSHYDIYADGMYHGSISASEAGGVRVSLDDGNFVSDETALNIFRTMIGIVNEKRVVSFKVS